MLSRLFESCFGLTFLLSSISHINNQFQFFYDILNYKIVSGNFAIATTLLVPTIEFIVGVGLVLGIARIGNLVSGCFLLLIFGIVQVSAYVRGLSIDCGCFGNFRSEISFKSIAFVFTLLIIGLVCSTVAIREFNREDIRVFS